MIPFGKIILFLSFILSWDNPKDRLELFVYKEDGSYLIEKNKYTKNFKTGETKWVSYEFDPNGVDEVSVNELVSSLN